MTAQIATSAQTKTLTDSQFRRLSALANYGTRYEAVVTGPDGRRALAGYLARNNASGLLAWVTSATATKMIAFLGQDETARMDVSKKTKTLTITGGGTLSFTGRTERQAIQEGEIDRLA